MSGWTGKIYSPVRIGNMKFAGQSIALKKADSLSEGGIFIIPARLERCDMPESLRRWQRVDLFEARGYEKLMSALKQCIVLG